MKNAQVPGSYRAWAHDYRPDLLRFISEVFGLPASPEQLDRIEAALQAREVAREQRAYDVYCLNDTDSDPSSFARQHVLMGDFLAAYFPVPSPWERPGA